ncbi:MAG: LBF_2804 family protein [Gammaproteobacteria bacterium]
MDAPLPDLEALGLRYLRRRAAVPSLVEPTDPIHILNPMEQAALRRIERGMVTRAAIAGALSGAASATAELIAIGAGPATATGWLWVVGVTLGATAVEIAFLYWDALRSVHDLAAAAGVRLFPPGVSLSAMTATALARAALELPNRPDPRLPVNPYRETSKAMLVAAAMLYKLKIGLTSFLLKALLRRMGGRALLRSWAPFVAVPVTAFWNAWVARTVIHEARIRVMGPSATRERLDSLLQARSPLSPAGRLAALRAAGCAVVGKRDLHPNLAVLIEMLLERLGAPADPIDDQPAFLAALPALVPAERDVVIELLAFALVLDGRLSYRERRLWQQARAACGLSPDVQTLRRLRRAFVAGRTVY